MLEVFTHSFTTNDDKDVPVRNDALPGPRRKPSIVALGVLALALGTLQSVVDPALPLLQRELGVSPAEGALVTNALLVTGAVITPVAATRRKESRSVGSRGNPGAGSTANVAPMTASSRHRGPPPLIAVRYPQSAARTSGPGPPVAT